MKIGRKSKYSLSETHRLLETGPVTLLTTVIKGKANVMVQSWHTMMDFDPPLIGCVVSNRGYSFDLLNRSNECVINIPTRELLPAVIGCGNVNGKSIDKFKKFKLTAETLPGASAPGIRECYASIVCKVVDRTLVEKYNFFILQATSAWVDRKIKDPKTLHHRGRGKFMIAGRSIQTRSKAK